MNISEIIPNEISNFLLVLVFSLLIGLGQRRLHMKADDHFLFGTDRTFTFIGLLGYILYLFDPDGFVPFLTGFVIVGIFLGIQYYQKIQIQKDFGLTTSILALLTYCLSFMVFTQPIWLFLSFVVAILILTEMKTQFKVLSKKASEEEFITLAKFLAFAGIILPLLPSENISSYVPVSPYQLWLAIVVVSGVSYASYLVKKFIFPKSGIMLTGILGGIYSSTATTVILARRAKEENTGIEAVSAIMLANGMMYLRVLVLVYVFNRSIGLMLTIPFLVMFGIAVLMSKLIQYKKEKKAKTIEVQDELSDKNPLELKTAIIFGFLFVLFGLITELVMKHYGESGVAGLAFLIGVFDVDPFLLYLLQQHSGIVALTITLAIINATNSNNLMKMIFAISLGNKELRKPFIISFMTLFISGLIISGLVYLLMR